MIRKLSIVLFALCLLGSTDLGSPLTNSAMAAGDYGVQVTDVLRFGGTASGACPQEDMTYRWEKIAETATTGNSYSYQNTWNYQNNIGSTVTNMDTFMSQLEDNMTVEGAGWAVSQMYPAESAWTSTNQDANAWIRIWVFDPSTTWTVTDGYMYASSTVKVSDFYLNDGAGCRYQNWQTNASTTYIPLSVHKFLLFKSDHVTYPQDFTGTELPQVQTLPRYVAMGDSFSSGEGNPQFELGTDIASTNECHRSLEAYPRILAGNTNLDLRPMSFVACSGATTDDVLTGGSGVGSWGEDPQVDALSSDTDVVTITIGGNDVGFSAFATECLFPVDTYFGHEGTCDEFTSIYDDTVDSIINDLPTKLEDTYSTILEDAPNATIYVVGYPEISPYKYIDDPFDQDCGGLYDEWPNTWGDARAAYEVVNLLNSTIEEAVDSVNTAEASTRLVYVDVTSGSFLGHDACSSTSYFNGIYWPTNTEYSVHPNADGQIAYQEDIEDAMS